ncbi:RNA polymerase Rpb4 family protein [Methanomassiliicoccus luminyensis]|jgi:DNA-directed RNA polymerase subunit F|uniref:RNA polymerase Rpb4 family protein n=1 Tax=Methanomassiliicoccus luminyensis TaxID=1080712 RepID=UPI000368F6AA|nr:RNA polymerase Rpb4 family protein [Methanomassiliicoccus luminyensis]
MPEERYVSLSEVKHILDEAGESRELSPDQRLAQDHAQKVARLSLEDARKLQAELQKLGFISEALSVKIVDLMPTHADDVRVLFSKERMVLEKKYIEQILSTVQKYQ